MKKTLKLSPARQSCAKTQGFNSQTLQLSNSSDIILAASVLGADSLNLERDLKACERTKLVDWIHADIMDGRFVPNISFGPDIVAAAKRSTSLFIDAHLMVERPKNFLQVFAKKGADLIVVHAEAKDSPRECLGIIRRLGLKAGLAIKPKTPVKKIVPFLDLIDLALVMTVDPGFSGQSFIEACVGKVREASGILSRYKRDPWWLQVDGGINDQTIAQVVHAGANVLVCGAALFREPPQISAPRLRRAIQKAVESRER